MSKKFKACIFLLLSVLIFIFMLAGCEIVPSVRANYVKLDGELWKDRVGERALVKDRNELLAFVEIMVVDLDELAKYDDNFFKSNALIVFNIIEESKDTQNEITSYAIENGTITINVETTKQGEGKDDQSTAYHFVLELSAKKASNITDIVILKNGTKMQGKAHALERVYNLHEALKLSWLTHEDIVQIANYNNNRLEPEKPLDDAIATKIKETRAAELRTFVNSNGELSYPDASIEDISIRRYCGEYHGYYVIMLEDGVLGGPQGPWTDIVDGVELEYGDGNWLLVWAEK